LFVEVEVSIESIPIPDFRFDSTFPFTSNEVLWAAGDTDLRGGTTLSHKKTRRSIGDGRGAIVI